MQVGEVVALLGGAGLPDMVGIGGEVSRNRGSTVESRQLSGRHVLAEGALRHAGVDEVFKEGGSRTGCGKRDK